MSQTTSHVSERVQEFYGPRVQQLIQESRPQQVQRPVRLSDIERKRRREGDAPGRLDPDRSGDEIRLFWSWIDNFLAKRKAKTSTNTNADTIESREKVFRGPPPIQCTSHSKRSSAAAAIAAIERGAQYTAKREMLEYESARYSLWGEIVYHYKAWRLKRAKRQADARRQTANEEDSRGQVAPEAVAPYTGERFHPTTYQTLASPTLQTHPRLAQQIESMDPNMFSPKTRKPKRTHTRNKSSGEVSKHHVKINHLPSIHNSVHLSQGPWNSYSDDESILQSKNGSSSRVTRFGDFIRRASASQAPSSRLIGAVPAIQESPNPPFPSIPDTLPSKSYQPNKSKSQPAHAAHTKDRPSHNGGLNISNVDFAGINSKGPVPRENSQCQNCGKLNSPGTGYGSKGVWLCSGCTSPESAQEQPPSSYCAPRKAEASGKPVQQPRSAAREKGEYSNKNGRIDGFRVEAGPCEYHNFSLSLFVPILTTPALPPKDFPSVSPLSLDYPTAKPAPLHYNRSHTTNTSNTSTPISPYSADPFTDFDSHTSHTNNPSIPPHHDGNSTYVSKFSAPCAKDSVYTSSSSLSSIYPITPTSSIGPATPRKDSDTLPFSTMQGIPRKAIGTPRKDSDTLPPNPPSKPQNKTKKLPSHPPKPPPPSKEIATITQPFPTRSTSLADAPKKKLPNIRDSRSRFPEIPIPPTPKSKELMHVPQRSSSIYPASEYQPSVSYNEAPPTLEEFSFDGKGSLVLWSGGERNTKDYEYWGIYFPQWPRKER